MKDVQPTPVSKPELIEYLNEVIKWEQYRIEQAQIARALYDTHNVLWLAINIEERKKKTERSGKYSAIETIPEYFLSVNNCYDYTIMTKLWKEIIGKYTAVKAKYGSPQRDSRGCAIEGILVYALNENSRHSTIPDDFYSSTRGYQKDQYCIEVEEKWKESEPKQTQLPIPAEKPKGLFGAKKLKEEQLAVQEKQKVLDREYSEKRTAWEKEKEKAAMELRKEYFCEMQLRCEEMCKQLDIMMEECIEKYHMISDTLSALYSKGVLFPKYQNFIAATTFLEYLQSGRCDALEGEKGAYNLYENEQRLDQINTKLDIVITKLEEIKQNQYMLYSAMMEVNKHVEAIEGSISEIAKDTHEIVNNTALTAHYARITADNTTALKYIALIK